MKMSIHKFDNSSFGTFCSFVLPLILLLQISIPGIALCIGSDGHVALENYSDGLCNEMVSESESLNNSYSFRRTLNSLNSQHCGRCVDVLISDNNSENKVTSLNNLTPEIDLHALAAYVLPPLWFQENSNQRLLIQDIPTSYTFLDSLQTTVITC